MMDVCPTVVEAISGDLTPGRFAKSLLPIATGQKDRIRPIAISEIDKKAPLRMMARDERFKYWADEDREYLFDLETDPLKHADLSTVPEHRETLIARKAPHPPPKHTNQPLRWRCFDRVQGRHFPCRWHDTYGALCHQSTTRGRCDAM
jgi:hypothetical protein